MKIGCFQPSIVKKRQNCDLVEVAEEASCVPLLPKVQWKNLDALVGNEVVLVDCCLLVCLPAGAATLESFREKWTASTPC